MRGGEGASRSRGYGPDSGRTVTVPTNVNVPLEKTNVQRTGARQVPLRRRRSASVHTSLPWYAQRTGDTLYEGARSSGDRAADF